MELAELAARTGLAARKLRYVLDHRLLPGRRGDGPGHGVPRSVTPFEGFAVAVAARLLDAGLTRRLVATALATLAVAARGKPVGSAPLLAAFTSGGGRLEFGDGRGVRLSAPGRPGVQVAVDTGWRPLTLAERLPDGYSPMVRVTFDLDELAGAIRRLTPEPG